VWMERRECFCNEQFNVKACSVQGIYKTADVLAKDPASFSCSNRVNLISTFSSSCFAWLTLQSGGDSQSAHPAARAQSAESQHLEF
jgi:hypothetical protein